MLRCTLHRNTHSRAVGGSVETPRAMSAGLYELYYGKEVTDMEKIISIAIAVIGCVATVIKAVESDD